MVLHSVTVSQTLYQRLEQQAQTKHASVDEVVQQTLSRHLPPLLEVEEDLPLDLQTELEAMALLSDDALWALARSSLSQVQLEDMETLNRQAQLTDLTDDQEEHRKALLDAYDRVVLRRAHATTLLQGRGFKIADQSLLQDA